MVFPCGRILFSRAGGQPAHTERSTKIVIFLAGGAPARANWNFACGCLSRPHGKIKNQKKNKISKKKAIRRWRRRYQPPPPPPCHRHRRPRRPRTPLPPSSEAAAASMPPAAGIHAPLQPHHCRRAPPLRRIWGEKEGEGRGGEGSRISRGEGGQPPDPRTGPAGLRAPLWPHRH